MEQQRTGPPVRRGIPNHILVTEHVLRDLGKAVDPIFDSLPDIKDRLVFLGQLQLLEKTLGETRAWIESRCAGAMPKSKVEDKALGLLAQRSPDYRWKWEDRRLLFELLMRRERATVDWTLVDPDSVDSIVSDMERYVWDLVDFVLEHGAYSPRVTPLVEKDGWSKEDVDSYRKKEPARRSVKVTFTEEGEDDGDGEAPGPDGGPETVDSPAEGQGGDPPDA